MTQPNRFGATVQGRCPACGKTSLFLGNGGYVTCARLDCPEPDAATTVLEHQQPTQPAERHTVDTITSDALDQLYAERDRLRAELDSAYRRHDSLDSLQYALGGGLTHHCARAEKAEAERDAATARLHELGITTANPEPSWQCPDCGGLVPISQRHIHQEAEQRTRAETAEAAIERVRAVLDRLDAAALNADGIPLTARERGMHTATTRIRAALDPQEPQP